MTNFQDVLRDVHDPSTHALKTTASLSASTVYVGNPTLYAVVNTGAATDPGIYIGLTTSTIGNNPVLGSGVNNIGFATVSVSNPTLYAVVNTGAVGVTNSIVTVANTPLLTQIIGNVTISDSKTYIGLVTATLANQPALTAGLANIGFATVYISTPTLYAVVNTSAPGTTDVTSNSGITIYQGGTFAVTQSGTWDEVGINDSGNSITVDGNVGILGNVTISPSINSIGFATVHLGAGNSNIGDVDVASIAAGANYIGLVSVNGTVVNATGTNNIGSVSVLGGGIGINAGVNGIGFATVNVVNLARTITGNLTVLVAGSTKTFISQPIAFAGTSVATIAVPTNTFKMTNLLLNANATVGISIKSGVTYLTGNASIRVTLSPTGGWVESGSVEAPVYIGLAGAAAIVVEKNDATTAVAGKVMYFDE